MADKSSKGEKERYAVLQLQQLGNIIKYLEHHPKSLVISINDIEVFKYTPDFLYLELSSDIVVYEEYKGFMRQRHDSLLRMKCASAVHPLCEFRLYEGNGNKAVLTRVYKAGKAIRQFKNKKTK